jgi:MFS family permease
MIYPVLLPEIRTAYGFDLATAGLLLTVLWAANAAGQFPGGVLADRIGEQRTLMVGVGLSAVTVVLIISVGSVIALFAATMLLGMGLALYGVARYTVMYEIYPERAGTTIGIVLAAADAGQALLPPLASSIALLAVWELGFGFTLPIFGLVFVGMWLYVPSVPAAGSSGDSPGLWTVLAAMYTREIGYGTAVFVLYVAVWVAFTSFYPTYLIEVKGLSSTTASILFGSFFAAGVIVKPLSGAIYDRFGVRTTLLVLAPVSALALSAVPFVEGIASIAVITLLVAPLLGCGTIAQSYLIALLADDIQGTGLGIVRTCGLLIGSTTPLLFGLGAEYGYFDENFLALAALVGVMVVLILLLSGE